MYIYRLVFLLVIALYIASPRITDWWIEPGSSWYRPYLFWAAIIAVSYWLTRWRQRNGV